MVSPGEAARPLRHAPGQAGDLLDRLRLVVDPEVGLDVVNMGLIRGLEVEDGIAWLRMTLTTRGCPMADVLLDDVRYAIEGAGLRCEVELEFEPPWSPDQISEAGRRVLNGPGKAP
ncbi:MAG: metal-sulfur cluster assembly factor [Alphaproteobacteria bacterium]|nr:metal-sulfur cluster assembly factor [Alphaproteobacteria bacterium]